MKKKTGSKPRKPKAPPALDIQCPSCGAAPKQPCILIARPAFSERLGARSFEGNLGVVTSPSPAPHASRLATFAAKASKPKRPRPR